jgi:hypothetical protein
MEAKVKPESDYQRMCRAIDAAPPEYFAGFGITKESWQDWRAGGRGTRSGGKLKWHFPLVTEVHYPREIKTTQDRHNWIRALNMDRRVPDRARRVLTNLILYLNPKNGRCDPTLRHLAMMSGLGEDDSAEVMARSAIRNGEKLGWIKRHYRYGGGRYLQSSRYEFLIPAAIRDCWRIGLQIIERNGQWFAAQTDGVEICGPFKAKASVEKWIREHGPTEHRPNFLRDATELQSSVGIGNRGTGNISKKITPVAEAPGVFSKNLSPQNESKGESEKKPDSPSRESPYTEREVQIVRGILGEGNGGRPIGEVVAAAREQGAFITANIIGYMCRDGHFGRDGEHVFLLDEKEDVEPRTSE